MLEHLTSGERDEALAGDLLEQFRAGRTDGWYWGQVIAACVVSWSKTLTVCGPALVFALVWCLMAPAWQVLVEKVENAAIFEKFWRLVGPFWLPLMLAGWTALHAAFLWAALLVYQSAHAFLHKPIRERSLRRGFLLAALVLPPAMGITFVFANLFWYSLTGLQHARLATSFSDLEILPDLIRVPYFVALVSALWGTIPRHVRRGETLLDEPLSDGASTQSRAIAVASTLNEHSVKRFLVFMVGAGLVSAMIAGLVLCRLSDPVALHLGPLLTRAFHFVAVGTLAGVVGAYIYWQNPWSPFRDWSPLPFPLFALACASGWVWVPAMVLFSEAMSTGTAYVAMIGAFVLAAGLRSVSYFAFVPASLGTPSDAWGGADLFEESLYRAPVDLTGYAIAIGIFLAGAALAVRSISTAAVLLALSAAVFAWKRTIPPENAFESRTELRKAFRRVALVLVPAVLITAWALFDNTLYRERMAQVHAVAVAGGNGADGSAAKNKKTKIIANGPGGYESLILWPYPEKKQKMPAIVMPDSLLAPGTKRPLTIRFDGPYLYVQPPNKAPDRDAHQAHGTPVDVDIETNNFIPVVMTARQSLATPIRTRRCREIEVEIEDRDNVPGPISLALLLTDEGSTQKKTLYLGQQPIMSADPGQFSFKTEPAVETLHFPVPDDPEMRQFSTITVLVLPDIQHRFVAPKIAIQQFQIFPR
jgi:hypothetical protein